LNVENGGMSEVKTMRIVEVLKGIAHPLRLRIVVLLCEENRSVTEMTEILEVSQSLISQHLSVMRLSGLVEVDQTEGRRYKLKELMLHDLVSCLGSCKAR